MISFSSSANRYIKYAYNASGTLIRKQQYDNVGGVATLQTTTDYIDGFVFTTAGAGTAALQYFNMPEGRVLNNAGTLSQEFTIADQQGNVRIAFDNTGTGGIAKTRQENSYYTFGMIMPGSVVATPGNQNRNLYNGGSEWQNDYGNLPDYYQTFYRNYDAALGRWIGVDPKGESAESMTGYQYAGNNHRTTSHWNVLSTEDGLALLNNSGSHDFISFSGISNDGSGLPERHPSIFDDTRKDIRFPDYFALNISIAIPNPWTGTVVGINLSASLDRNGHYHISPFGVSAGNL
jgi:RHS repeat-associated protein